jgi:3-hydroxyisobutyrate dehydrogenase
MGEPMVRQLVRSGHEVAVHDLDAQRVQALARSPGVTPAPSLADLANARLVICMLPDSSVVGEVVSGHSGLLSVLSPNDIILDMGSSDPRQTVALAASASAVGVHLVDAPVSGGVRQARTGELTIMFGGPGGLLERCRPVLQAIGSSIVHVGGVGAGHALKALNNVMSAVGLTVACEVLNAGRAFGLDSEIMLEVLNRSTGRNHATETKMSQFVLSETYDSGFLMRLMIKDLSTAVALSSELGTSTPLTDACLAVWQEAYRRLPPDADQTRIAEAFAARGLAPADPGSG